jgi:hypothetical protein
MRSAFWGSSDEPSRGGPLHLRTMMRIKGQRGRKRVEKTGKNLLHVRRRNPSILHF